MFNNKLYKQLLFQVHPDKVIDKRIQTNITTILNESKSNSNNDILDIIQCLMTGNYNSLCEKTNLELSDKALFVAQYILEADEYKRQLNKLQKKYFKLWLKNGELKNEIKENIKKGKLIVQYELGV